MNVISMFIRGQEVELVFEGELSMIFMPKLALSNHSPALGHILVRKPQGMRRKKWKMLARYSHNLSQIEFLDQDFSKEKFLDCLEAAGHYLLEAELQFDEISSKAAKNLVLRQGGLALAALRSKKAPCRA